MNFKSLERILVAFVCILVFLMLAKCTVIFENSRIARAKIRINNMSKLAFAYYQKNNAMETMQNADVWEDDLCTAATFYRYWVRPGQAPGQVDLVATRCSSGGMPPNTTRPYNLYLSCDYGTGQNNWHCSYQDNGSACFGLTK